MISMIKATCFFLYGIWDIQSSFTNKHCNVKNDGWGKKFRWALFLNHFTKISFLSPGSYYRFVEWKSGVDILQIHLRHQRNSRGADGLNSPNPETLWNQTATWKILNSGIDTFQSTLTFYSYRYIQMLYCFLIYHPSRNSKIFYWHPVLKLELPLFYRNIFFY